jgi:integrase
VNRDIVFASPTGDYIHPDTVSKTWGKSARRAGVENVRLHDLRHAHAEGLIRANVHPKVVQERLGHSSAAFTLNVYGHVSAGLQARAAEAFEKQVAEGNG